jgi:AcrR family transcriptional regulator
MAPASPALQQPPVRRRDLQKDQTRLDLALAAFELARQHALAAVRVPQIAAATGVSPRTFNNYFPSKEAAIASAVEAPLADAIARRMGATEGQLFMKES